MKQKEEQNKWEIKARDLLLKILNKEPVREYKFHPSRKWRFDFAYPEQFIAIEVEGGIWIGGRHIHPLGFEKDCEKYNEAAKLGWKVYRITPSMIKKEYLESILTV